MDQERKAFNFLKSYYEVLKMLPNAESKTAYIEAICKKQFDGEDPILEGMENFAYVSQKHSIDKSRKGWEDVQKKRNPAKTTPTQREVDGRFSVQPIGNPIGNPNRNPTVGGKGNPTEQEKEKEKEQEKEQEQEKVKKEIFNFRKTMIDLGFDKELTEDWLKVRKTKRATNTKTALKSFLKEIEKSKINKNEILKICVERSWSGFKASFLENKGLVSEKAKGSLNAIEKLRNELFNTQENGKYPRI